MRGLSAQVSAPAVQCDDIVRQTPSPRVASRDLSRSSEERCRRRQRRRDKRAFRRASCRSHFAMRRVRAINSQAAAANGESDEQRRRSTRDGERARRENERTAPACTLRVPRLHVGEQVCTMHCTDVSHTERSGTIASTIRQSREPHRRTTNRCVMSAVDAIIAACSRAHTHAEPKRSSCRARRVELPQRAIGGTQRASAEPCRTLRISRCTARNTNARASTYLKSSSRLKCKRQFLPHPHRWRIFVGFPMKSASAPILLDENCHEHFIEEADCPS